MKRLSFCLLITCLAVYAQNPDFSLSGFASLEGGTTGGAGGDIVTVSSGQELYNALKGKGNNPLTVYIEGKLDNYPSSKIEIKEMSDISIIGKGSSAELDGIGIKIWKASNIIIRNLKIHHVSEGDGDCIGIEGPSDHVWVDHCELYNDLDHDKDYYDGLLDAKGDCDYITFSWNYLHDSWKTSLVGSSDSDIHDRKITYHHNYIANCNSRLPSYRFGHGHIFNNYYENSIESTINCRMGAEIRIENNYFKNCVHPVTYLYSDESGFWDVADNIYDNCTGDQPASSTCSYIPPYQYDLDNAADIPEIVKQYAGVGVIDGNDNPVTTFSFSATVQQGQGMVSPQNGTYKKNQTVTVTATASGGWEFDHWEGDITGNTNPVTITMDSDKSINACFKEKPGTNEIDTLEYPEGDIFVSPDGDDSNEGTEESPFKTIEKAIETVSSGKVIYLRGGIYRSSNTVLIQKSGSENAPIKMYAYKGEKPVLDFSQMPENSSNRGVVLDADYWHIRGIIIEQAGDNGMLLSGNYNIIEKSVFRKNKDSGLQLSRYNSSVNNISQWPSYNLILDCESHDNSDSGHENADGFAPKLTCGEGNVFRNCIAHHNIDDGWDMYTKSETGAIGVIFLDRCIAHNNGTLSDGNTSGSGDKNGFKLGSSATLTNHIVRRCIAFKNGKHGFTDNGNTSSIEFTNNTAWDNGDYNFHVRDGANHVFRNNVSFDGGHTDRIVGQNAGPNALTGKAFDWPFTASASDFESMTPGPDNDPLSNGFLKPGTGSSLIDAGVVSEGITFHGSAPDLGAIETGMTTGTPDITKKKTLTNKTVWSNNSAILLECDMKKAGIVKIRIVNGIGRTVYYNKTALNSGKNIVKINRSRLSGGVYFASIATGKVETFRLILN
ncbi:MAG: DUF1565 domain-containing protein [Fibrobacter sp.]|nr:DUF1565 domain-containing protein [Fibrobacter sp.]